jgi:Leucine-rich repeat (LRR) protein
MSWRNAGCTNCRKNAFQNVEESSRYSKPPRPPSKSQKRSQLQEIFTKKVETIVSFQNQNITKVNRSEIEKYEKYLGFDFSHNTLHFTNDLCSAFKYIRFLNLSSNKLTSLPQDLHLMENLAVLDLTRNEISKLPMNIHLMGRLEWLDLRQNPFLTTWNQRKGLKGDEFNPKEFAFQVRSFMRAARDWRDYSLQKRAQELAEFLVICPPQQPLPDDADYDLSQEDYRECPLYKMAGSSPNDLKKQITILEQGFPPKS